MFSEALFLQMYLKNPHNIHEINPYWGVHWIYFTVKEVPDYKTFENHWLNTSQTILTRETLFNKNLIYQHIVCYCTCICSLFPSFLTAAGHFQQLCTSHRVVLVNTVCVVSYSFSKWNGRFRQTMSTFYSVTYAHLDHILSVSKHCARTFIPVKDASHGFIFLLMFNMVGTAS